ncbi:MAG: S-ribosylhomocysteine lyase [Bacilli bacterium]
MAQVESFTLDHNIVLAPYVRVAGKQKQGLEVITKFDLRFKQPNVSTIDCKSIHTLEHLLADYLRDELPDLIDISPMGCRTGFYLIIWNYVSPEVMAHALKKALERVLEATSIQGDQPVSCGSYLDHDLQGAKQEAQLVLNEGISIDVFKRVII